MTILGGLVQVTPTSCQRREDGSETLRAAQQPPPTLACPYLDNVDVLELSQHVYLMLVQRLGEHFYRHLRLIARVERLQDNAAKACSRKTTATMSFAGQPTPSSVRTLPGQQTFANVIVGADLL